MRAGWLTGGVMFQIAEPTWMPLGARGDVREEDLRRGDVRVLLEEVVLDRPDVLEVPRGRTATASSSSRMRRRCSAPAGIGFDLVTRDVRLDEESEFHGDGAYQPVEWGGKRAFDTCCERRRGGPVSAF